MCTDLSAYVEENVIPNLERVGGVASVSSTGLVEQMVEVRLDQGKIDEVNDRLLVQVSDRLAEAKQQLDDARRQLDDSEEALATGQAELDNKRSRRWRRASSSLPTSRRRPPPNWPKPASSWTRRWPK